MALELLTGPPGSGKTTRLLRLAREFADEGRRVLWIGLPAQRNSVTRRLAEGGSLIGTEFVSEQQFCYRLLSRARQLRPLRVGTERLALVGAALAEVRGAVPQPGEARLFSAAIAELKRNGLTPDGADGLAFDSETQRLAEVFRAYERLKAGSWDYDDYRREAGALAARGAADPGAELLIVAGYREILPVTLDLYADLARDTEVRIALPEAPAFPPGTQVRHNAYAAAPQPAPARYRARNETEEIRFVLRDVKQALAEGATPADLAVVAPGRSYDMFLALAGEYGIPFAAERPRTLADTRAGRILLELIALHDFTGPGALLALPGLGRLAATALREKVSGRPALMELARRLDESAGREETPEAGAGLAQQLEDWLGRIDAEVKDYSWAEGLVELLLTEILPHVAAGEPAQFREHVLRCAGEARQLGSGPSFRAWWAALVEETLLPADGPAGVALLTPALCSGRRYARAWLTGAVRGAYADAPAEDYFLPEETRTPEPTTGRLPRRLSGREELIYQELLHLADHLTITWASNTQDGTQHAETGLLGTEPALPLPRQPAGNPGELRGGLVPAFDHRIAPTALRLPAPEAQWLAFYGECPQRAWAEALLRESADLDVLPGAPWEELRRRLTKGGRASPEKLRELAAAWPGFADWLDAHADLLGRLHFGLQLPRGRQFRARIDASGRIDGAVHLYRFAAPDSIPDAEAAAVLLGRRVAERWLASYLLNEAPEPESSVRLFVWPIGADPIEVTGDTAGRWLRRGHGDAEDGFEAYLRGDVRPRPSRFRCRGCRVADMCRKSAA